MLVLVGEKKKKDKIRATTNIPVKHSNNINYLS